MAKLTIDLNHFKKKDYISRSKGKPSLFVMLPEWQWYDWRKDINTIKELKFCLVNDWKFYRILYKRQLRIFTMEMYGFARSHTIFQCLWEFCHILEAYVFYSEVFFFLFFFLNAILVSTNNNPDGSGDHKLCISLHVRYK